MFVYSCKIYLNNVQGYFLKYIDVKQFKKFNYDEKTVKYLVSTLFVKKSKNLNFYKLYLDDFDNLKIEEIYISYPSLKLFKKGESKTDVKISNIVEEIAHYLNKHNTNQKTDTDIHFQLLNTFIDMSNLNVIELFEQKNLLSENFIVVFNQNSRVRFALKNNIDYRFKVGLILEFDNYETYFNTTRINPNPCYYYKLDIEEHGNYILESFYYKKTSDLFENILEKLKLIAKLYNTKILLDVHETHNCIGRRMGFEFVSNNPKILKIPFICQLYKTIEKI